MRPLDLEQARAAWKNSVDVETAALSREQVDALLQRESAGISQMFRRGLALDLSVKSVFLPALAMLLVLFRDGATISWINTVVLAVVAFLAFYQWKTLQALPGPSVLGDTVRTYLLEITHFYRHRYVWAVCVSALTAPLVFYTGSQYYSYLRYGGLRPLDTQDLAVFGLFLLLAFGIGVIAHLWQFRVQIRELESCLHDLDDGTGALRQAGLRESRRQKFRLVAVTLAVLGVLALAYLVFA